MKEMTSKTINLGLSKEWGLEDFIKNYNLADVDDLKNSLRRIHNGNETKVSRDIKKMKSNSKKKQRKSNVLSDIIGDEIPPEYRAVKVDQMVATVPYKLNVTNALVTAENNITDYEQKQVKAEITTDAEITANVEITTDTENSADAKEDIVANNEPKDTSAQLEELNEKLNEINEKIISSESSTKLLYARKREASNVINYVCGKLRDLETEVSTLKSKFENAYKDHSAVEKEIADEKIRMNDLQNEKTVIMSQIRELTSVSLYCDSSDDSDFNYRLEEFEIEAQEVNKKMKSFFESEFSDSDLLDDFSVSELKKAAKIILAIEKIEEEAETSNIELWFDEKNNFTGLLELMGKKVIIISK